MIDRRGHASVPRSLPAAALLVGAALASLVVGCGSPVASATPTTAATPAPTASASAPTATLPPLETPEGTAAGTPACAVADLKASHGLVEGGAGSLMTEVLLVSATTCSVDAFPALGLRDGAGTALIGAPSTGPGAIDLVAGVAYVSQVRIANWCAPEPAFPLTLEVVLDAGELPVTGSSFPEEGDLPPCNGEGGPILEGSGWMPSP